MTLHNKIPGGISEEFSCITKVYTLKVELLLVVVFLPPSLLYCIVDYVVCCPDAVACFFSDAGTAETELLEHGVHSTDDSSLDETSHL